MEARRLSTANSETFRLALRVRHPSMDPAELSRAFGIEPEYSFRAGSVRPSRSGMTTASVRSESYWLGELPTTEQPLGPSFLGAPRIGERQLEAIRNNLTWTLSLICIRVLKNHAELLRRIRSGGGEITLLVTLFGSEVGSFSLLPEASRVFGDLGVALEFELAGQ